MDFELSSQQKLIQRIAREFADREIEPIADEVERESKIPSIPDMLSKMAKARLLGMLTPKEYGGAETGFLTYILAMEQIHYPCSACSHLMNLPNTLSSLINRFGTPKQKEEYLPSIAEGKVFPSMVFTEPDTGSDPKMLTTTAHVENGCWVINGMKRFHTWGHLDGPSIIFAKTDEDRISAIIVPKNIPGYSCSKPWGLMGSKGLETVDTYFDDVRVPEENLFGERGNAYKVLLSMSAGGKLDLSIRAVACGQRALDEAIKYAKQRKTRKGPVSAMQGHQWLFAEMASRVQASRWLTYRGAFLEEQGKEAGEDCAIARLFATQSAVWVASQAFSIHGAYGFTTDYKIEKIFKATLELEITEGTNEVQRSIVGASLVAD